MTISKEDIKNILALAVYAPSGDNSQPWRFAVKGNEIHIFNLPDRDNPYLNFRQSGSYVAHGGLIENIAIAVSHYGYKANVILFPDDKILNWVAKVTLEPQSPGVDPLYPFIKERCTNRKPYKPKKLTSGQKNDLIKCPEEVAAGKVILLDGNEQMKALGKAGSITERIVLETPFLHKLFFDDLVWTEGEERQKKRGLYLKTFELPTPAEVMFRIIKHWQVMNLLNKTGFSRSVAKTNGRLYSSGGALGIIVIPDNSGKGYVNAGRIMQRIWLKATKMGLALQPVTGVLFIVQRIFANEAKELSEGHLQLVKEAYQTIKASFRVDDGTIAMMFRVGYADSPTARSSRMEPVVME